MNPIEPAAKVTTLEALLPQIVARRGAGQHIVLTNGVFDLLHVGHVRYLTRARALGDVLVVGVNSDASARSNKAFGRPIVSQAERAELLAALAVVDFVVIFEEPTATNLVDALRPEVYVKGGDYSVETLPEAQSVGSHGGRIEFVQFERGHSTSRTIDEIVRRFGRPAASR